MGQVVSCLGLSGLKLAPAAGGARNPTSAAWCLGQKGGHLGINVWLLIPILSKRFSVRTPFGGLLGEGLPLPAGPYVLELGL